MWLAIAALPPLPTKMSLLPAACAARAHAMTRLTASAISRASPEAEVTAVLLRGGHNRMEERWISRLPTRKTSLDMMLTAPGGIAQRLGAGTISRNGVKPRQLKIDGRHRRICCAVALFRRPRRTTPHPSHRCRDHDVPIAF